MKTADVLPEAAQSKAVPLGPGRYPRAVEAICIAIERNDLGADHGDDASAGQGAPSVIEPALPA